VTDSAGPKKEPVPGQEAPNPRLDDSELFVQKAFADEAREDLGDDLTDKPGKNRRPVGRVSE
jgi:hypothetical protein